VAEVSINAVLQELKVQPRGCWAGGPRFQARATSGPIQPNLPLPPTPPRTLYPHPAKLPQSPNVAVTPATVSPGTASPGTRTLLTKVERLGSKMYKVCGWCGAHHASPCPPVHRPTDQTTCPSLPAPVLDCTPHTLPRIPPPQADARLERANIKLRHLLKLAAAKKLADEEVRSPGR
jgi:hypothetical protein